MEQFKSLHMESIGKESTAYKLRLGSGNFGGDLGIFPDQQAAIAEFVNICDALRDGLHYYKISAPDNPAA